MVIIPSKGELVLGEWNDNFTRNYQYAKENHIPILSFWSTRSCAYCNKVAQKVLQSEQFKIWANKAKIVMQYEQPQYTPRGPEESYCMDFTRNAQYFYLTSKKVPEYNKDFIESTSFPFIRFYWVKKNGEIIDNPISGRPSTYTQYQHYNWNTTEQLIQLLEDNLVDWYNQQDVIDTQIKNVDVQIVKSESKGCTNITDCSYTYSNQLFNSEQPKTIFSADPLKAINYFVGYQNNGVNNKPIIPYYKDQDFITDGYKESFKQLLEIHKQTYRPLFILYGKNNNKATLAMNIGSTSNSRAVHKALGRESELRYSSDNLSYNRGFIYGMFCNDKDESIQEVNEVKQFILQYDDNGIMKSLPYPWFMIYGYRKADNVRFVRCGNLKIDATMMPNDKVQGSMSSFTLNNVYAFGKNSEAMFDIIELYIDIVGWNYNIKNTFNIIFNDWDGVILKNEQTVKINEDAVPPSNPTRDGYIFTGWKPDYHSVQSDLTCVAQYTKAADKFENPRYVSKVDRQTTLFQY